MVVKRKRPVGKPVEQGLESTALSRHDEEARVPRVFRVGALVSDPSGRGDAPKPSLEARDADDKVSSDAAAAGPSESPRRRRRRVTHGKVTIIRPDSSDAAGPVARRQAAETDGPVRTGSALFPADPDASARYEAVMAQIAALKRQAVALKRAEASRAVRWIRQAIIDYDLEARDLGL